MSKEVAETLAKGTILKDRCGDLWKFVAFHESWAWCISATGIGTAPQTLWLPYLEIDK